MAVKLCLTGKTTGSIGEELGIKPELIRRWKREYEQNILGSFSGNGNANLTPEQKEIVQLKRALKDAQEESEILKKAVRIFSKGDSKSFNS